MVGVVGSNPIAPTNKSTTSNVSTKGLQIGAEFNLVEIDRHHGLRSSSARFTSRLQWSERSAAFETKNNTWLAPSSESPNVDALIPQPDELGIDPILVGVRVTDEHERFVAPIGRKRRRQLTLRRTVAAV
jgi:hypothetical protein